MFKNSRAHLSELALVNFSDKHLPPPCLKFIGSTEHGLRPIFLSTESLDINFVVSVVIHHQY